MDQNDIRNIEQMKKHIRKVRTQKISNLAIVVIVIISFIILVTGIYLHQKWREKTEGSIFELSNAMAKQITTLAKPATWKLNAENVDLREDKEVVKQGVSQYQINISEPADGWINVKGDYDPDKATWHNNELLTQVYTDNEPSVDEVSHLFAAILSAYYKTDANEAYTKIKEYYSSVRGIENFSQKFVFGKAGNVYADIGLTNVDGGSAWYLEAGSYN